MNADRCARTLWEVTRDFSAESGDTQQLTDVRLALAEAVFETDGEGFPEPSAAPRVSDAWTRCVRAASEAKAKKDNGTLTDVRYVVIWPETESKPGMPERDKPALGLHWPFAGQPDVVKGPVLDGKGNKVKLFGYRAIDTDKALLEDLDSRPGLFPRQGWGNIKVSRRTTGPAPSARKYPQRWAAFLLVASVVLAAFAMLWVYSTTGTLKASGRQLLEGVEKQGKPGSIVLTHKSLEAGPTAAAEAEQNRLACLQMLQSRMNGNTDDLGASPCYLAMSDSSAAVKDKLGDINAFFWNASQTSGRFSLLIPMAISALAILALILSAGIALKDSFLGAIIDRRNRISLSRVQQLAWTVVLLGGYAVLGIVNITLLAGFVRDVGQVNELPAIDGIQAGSFFPSMDPSLWAVLGLTVLISPYLSRRILTTMDPSAETGQDVTTVVAGKDAGAKLEQRSEPLRSRWSDLFTGETSANASHVDVSRLQHLVITVLLLGGYIILLAEYVRSIDATAVLMAMTMGIPVFAAMPPIDATFVGLLALSHAGYLAFKNPSAVRPQGSV